MMFFKAQHLGFFDFDQMGKWKGLPNIFALNIDTIFTEIFLQLLFLISFTVFKICFCQACMNFGDVLPAAFNKAIPPGEALVKKSQDNKWLWFSPNGV